MTRVQWNSNLHSEWHLFLHDDLLKKFSYGKILDSINGDIDGSVISQYQPITLANKEQQLSDDGTGRKQANTSARLCQLWQCGLTLFSTCKSVCVCVLVCHHDLMKHYRHLLFWELHRSSLSMARVGQTDDAIVHHRRPTVIDHWALHRSNNLI